MGTRADFYHEHEGDLIWIASIAWDGYPDGIYIKSKSEEESNRNKTVVYTHYLTDCDSEEEYKAFLNDFLSGRDDVTYPQQGWPWPWENSHTTDYAYCFSDERKEVVIAVFGHGWYTLKELDALDIDTLSWDTQPKVTNFPDMTNIMNVAWDKRSGILILREED